MSVPRDRVRTRWFSRGTALVNHPIHTRRRPAARRFGLASERRKALTVAGLDHMTTVISAAIPLGSLRLAIAIYLTEATASAVDMDMRFHHGDRTLD